MKTYTIGTSWKRLLAVSAVLSAVMTGYSAVILAAPSGLQANPGTTTHTTTLGEGDSMIPDDIRERNPAITGDD